MPLVLAAIDLKLSPSLQEMTIRQDRLDSLCQIIRHAEGLYDVIDLLAVSTNRILQLAYDITQNVFCYSAGDSTRHLLVECPEEPHSRERNGTSCHKDILQLRASGPVQNWAEAFIQFPRAYLLISTAVDYSLDVGRLPQHSALPKVVRHTLLRGSAVQLPWTTCKQPHRTDKIEWPRESYHLNIGRRATEPMVSVSARISDVCKSSQAGVRVKEMFSSTDPKRDIPNHDSNYGGSTADRRGFSQNSMDMGTTQSLAGFNLSDPTSYEEGCSYAPDLPVQEPSFESVWYAMMEATRF
jgi:hypothetical protein